ncbi:ROK family transcriptional regulator [Rugosimonospora acidiphila]|uniref:ROK family transcriptional regulator n=1 Tax=Rugosimonospora acidiphila TaxID=556531 RepID=A0ABP9RTH5_9ACTN
MLLAALRGHGAVTRAELAGLTALPKTTVAGVVNRLLTAGVVVERPVADRGRASRAGRPPMVLDLAEPAGFVAVLSLTHVGMRVAVASFDGVIRGRRDIPMDVLYAAGGVVGPGVRRLAEILVDAGVNAGQLDCAVIGVPAPFTRGAGSAMAPIREPSPEPVTQRRALLAGLRPDPAIELGDRLGVPASADNDANLAALGEAVFGAGRGVDNFVYLKVVDGVGVGLILNGRLYRGAQGLAGELAHVQVRDDGPWCACGGRGCLRSVVGFSMVAVLEPAYQRPVAFGEVLALVAAGDPGIRRILSDAGRRIGRVLADVCVVLNPEAIVVDGMLRAAAEPFLAGVRDAIERHTPNNIGQGVRLLAGELGEEAEILGAVALAGAELVDR